MTPHNIVGLAKIMELDVIAITDHNAVGNCKAAMEVGKELEILVLPGMELSTSEEVHMVCLFPTLEAGLAFEASMIKNSHFFDNEPEVFGEQLIMDSQDKILGEEKRLLIGSSGISIDEAPSMVREFGGICYPAHIDRSSNSVISNLGMIDPSMDFNHVEIQDYNATQSLIDQHPILKEKTIMYSSDAHYLENFAKMEHHYIKVEELSPKGIFDWFNNKI